MVGSYIPDTHLKEDARRIAAKLRKTSGLTEGDFLDLEDRKKLSAELIRLGYQPSAARGEAFIASGLRATDRRAKDSSVQLSGGPWTMEMSIYGARPARVPVASSEDASRKMQAFIRANNLGASELGRDCGVVRDAKGAVVARISYNGRVWTPSGAMAHERATDRRAKDARLRGEGPSRYAPPVDPNSIVKPLGAKPRTALCRECNEKPAARGEHFCSRACEKAWIMREFPEDAKRGIAMDRARMRRALDAALGMAAADEHPAEMAKAHCRYCGMPVTPGKTCGRTQCIERAKREAVKRGIAMDRARMRRALDDAMDAVEAKSETLYGSAPSLEGIKSVIKRFYAGEEKTLVPETKTTWKVVGENGRILSTRVVKKGGRYRFVA